MLVGYVHPEDEDAAFDADGFYRTGDQGRLVDGDHLVVTGRIKDIIIRNGENISPKEIEDLLAGHPGIAEVSIVGVPDPRTGERAVRGDRPARRSQARCRGARGLPARVTAWRGSRCPKQSRCGRRCPRTTRAR